jgi:hypothetical protein
MLGIDVDGVIADSHVLLIALLQARGHEVCIDDITAWNFGRLREKTRLTTGELVEIFWHGWREHPGYIPPVDDCVIQVVNDIIIRYDARIVTANPVPTVKDWLERIGIRTDYFVIQEDKSAFGVLVEDNPNVNAGHVILRDRPWNREAQGPRIYHSAELPPLLKALADEGKISYREQT